VRVYVYITRSKIELDGITSMSDNSYGNIRLRYLCAASSAVTYAPLRCVF
jgi:hypothetical protein